MPARKARVEMYWTTEKKSKEEIAAEKAAGKAKGIIWQRTDVFRHVINWRLVGANGEIMCGSTQGYTSRQSARESIARCGHLLFGAGSNLTPTTAAKITGPGRKPEAA